MDWNFKFGILQGAFYLPFLFISILHVPIAVSQSTFLNDPTINPSNGSLIFGSSQTLNCSVLGNPQPSVSWYRANQTVLTGITTSTISFGTAVRVDSLFTFTVAIVDNQRSIKCKVNNSASNELVVTAVFNVKATPSMVLSGPGNYIINGSNTNIQHVCVAMNGFPKPSLSFYLNNTKLIGNTDLSSTNGDYTYNVQSTILWLPTLVDSGKLLKCQDSVSGNEKSMLITVQQIPSLSIGSSYSGDYGASVTLVCSVLTAVPQVSSYSWKKSTSSPDNFITYSPPTGRSTIQTSANSQSLTIFNLQSGDAGRYKCVGTSAIGFGESNIANLILTGSVPVISIPSPSSSVNYGSSITLQCTVNSVPTATSVYWERNVNGVITTIDTTQSKYSGSLVQSPSLIIFNAEESDQGSYLCNAINSIGRGTSSSIFLTVISNTPTVQVGSQTYSAVVGDSVQIVCSVTSANPPITSIVWEKTTTNGGTVTLNIFNEPRISGGTTSNPSIFISSVQSSDEGTYSCSAVNSVGQGPSVSAYLDINSPPTTSAPLSYPTIIITKTVYTTTAGNTVILKCNVTDSNSALRSISWQKIRNGVSEIVNMSDTQKYSGSTINNPSLTINNTIETDTAIYVVTAENVRGAKTVSQPITLNVTGNVPTVSIPTDSYFVNYGSNVLLVCNVNADPALTGLKWQKKVNNAAIDVDMSNSRYSGGNKDVPSLTITNANLNDAGNYTCVATNVAGTTTSRETKLTVVTISPTVNIPDQNYNVMYGNDVTIPCVITNAVPSVTTVYWNKTVNSVSSVINTGGFQTKYTGSSIDYPSLNISNTVLDDSASYTCSATNLAGTGTSSARYLNVISFSPTVNIPDQNYTVMYGNNVTIPCVITNAVPSVTTVYWNKTVNSVSSVINTGGFQTKYTGSSIDYPSLNISNAVLDDSASYTCSANNLVGTGTSSARYLNVIAYVPTVVIPQASYSILAGNDLTIPCSISGTPTASNYSWTFTSASTSASLTIWNTNTKYTLASLSNPSLTILNLAPSDNGTYRCEAYNVAGKGTDSTQVIVTGSVPVVNIQNTQYSVLTGDSITIPCTISSSPSYTSAYWSFQKSNGQSLNVTSSSAKYTFQTTSSGTSLTVLNSNAADAGTYLCIASNLIGPSQDSALLAVTGNKPTVTIAEATWFVEILKNVTLGCSVTALPNATSVQWNKTVNGVSTQLDIAGNTLKYSGGSLASPSLTIIKAQETDEGEYFCIAKNAVGEGSKATFLNVTGGVPVLSIPQSSYSVTKTLNVTIPCSLITSTPPLQSVRWEFKPDFTGAVTNITIGGQFSGATTAGLSLTIAFANANNQGSYRCVGINTVGEGKSGFTNLTVTGSVPSSPSLSTALVNVIKGNNTQVVCTSTGNPPPTIAWSFNGQIIAQGQTLSLNNVQKSDRGTYTCTATNVVGSVQSTLTVNVQYAPINANTQTSYTVIAGQGVTLTCNTDANPPSTYRWTNPGGVLIASTQNVTVSTTDTGGFGTYTCTATNSLGSLNVDFVVTKSTTGGSIGASTVASGGLSSGEIAAVVLAILLLVILIIVICFCCFSHGVCGVICGKKESKAAVEPVKEKEVIKEKEFVIPRFHEESIKGKSTKAMETYRHKEPIPYRVENRPGSFKSYPYANGVYRQPSAVSRKDVDVKVNHYRNENDYEIIRYENVAPAATTLGTIVSVPEEHREPHPHRLPQMNYTYEEEERRRKHRRKKKRRRKHQKRESEDVVVETVRRPSPVRYVEEEVIGEVVRPSPPVCYVDDAGEDVVVERVIRRNPSPSRFYRPEPEQPGIIETVRRSHSASPNPGRRHIYQDEGEEVIITERSLSRSPSRRRREERYVTEERIVNGDVIHDPDDMDLRAYDGVVVREPRLSRHGSGRYHVESERRQHRNRSRKYDDDDDDYGPEVVQGREYILDK